MSDDERGLPNEDELRSITGISVEDGPSARSVALDILEEALIPAATKVKAMVADMEEIKRDKFDVCRWIIEFFFGRAGAAPKADEQDWEGALATLSAKMDGKKRV